MACRIQKPGQEPQEFIIKLLRPGIEQRAGRERAYFEDVASRYEGISGTYATVADQIEGELDLRREAEQVSQGQVYTQAGRDGVQSMRLAEGFAPQKNALIIERAPGQTVKSFIESTRASNLSAEQRLALIEEGRGLASNLSKLTGVWLKEVVYGSGFYHGDMHAGNILTHSEQGVTLIDFGNAGQIPPGEQRSFLLFQAALLKNKPGTAVEALAGLLPPLARSKFDEARNVIRAEVAQLMVKEARGELKQELAFAVVDALNKRGIEMPPAFVNLCRAQDMVQQALNQVAGRVDALITQAGDPKPAGCDRLEVDREVEQAISGSTRSLVGKLGVIKSLQLSQFTPASTLLADMRKLPDVVSGMNAYESKRLVYDEALQAHKAELGIFESRQDVMNAESEPGNERLGIHNRLYQHYEAEKVSDFPSVPENLRADLRRLVFEPKEVTALDFTPLTTLIDAMDPALMPKLRQADDALAALLVDRPKEPPKPAPVYEEDLYLEAIKAGSREPQAIAPLGLPAGVAPHVELVNLELQPA